MWYQVLIPSPLLLIPVLVMTTKCHTSKDNPNVIVISSKHIDTDNENPTKNDPALSEEEKLSTIVDTTTTKSFVVTRATTLKEAETEIIPNSNEDVLFIPNEKVIITTPKKTVEDYWREEIGIKQDDKMTLHALLNQRQKISEIMNPEKIKIETENRNEDVIFVTGKNVDEIEEPEEQATPKKKKEKKKRRQETFRKHPSVKKNPIRLNCTNLDCHNNLSSVCGGKLENRQWKYRLFLNECYFRKVNCYFKKRENRYQEVAIDNCENIGTHSTEPFEFKPYYQPRPHKPEELPDIEKLRETRRLSSRRSLSMGIDGRLCSHPCPVSCPEHYEPECAISGTGRIRVFMNHCKMDWNSCSYGIVWHRRPLANCVGGKKADMRQNRGFINWMQSVGIVDSKGRLVMN